MMLMPLLPHSLASRRVMPAMPDLLAVYEGTRMPPWKESMDAMLSPTPVMRKAPIASTRAEVAAGLARERRADALLGLLGCERQAKFVDQIGFGKVDAIVDVVVAVRILDHRIHRIGSLRAGDLRLRMLFVIQPDLQAPATGVTPIAHLGALP